MWFWRSVEDQSPSVDCVPNTAPQPNLEASVVSVMVGASRVKILRAPTIMFSHQLSSNSASDERDICLSNFSQVVWMARILSRSRGR